MVDFNSYRLVNLPRLVDMSSHKVVVPCSRALCKVPRHRRQVKQALHSLDVLLAFFLLQLIPSRRSAASNIRHRNTSSLTTWGEISRTSPCVS